MDAFQVDRETYEEVLDEDLPDHLGNTLTVDRRGYSRQVADELGTHYMDGTVYLFSTDQFTTQVERQDYDFIDDLIDQIRDTSERRLERLLQVGPVAATVQVNHPGSGVGTPKMTDRVSANIRMDWDRTPDRVLETFRTRKTVDQLDRHDIRDGAYLSQLGEAVDSYDHIDEVEPFHDRHGLELDRRIDFLTSTMRVEEFRFDLPDGEGYVLQCDDRTGALVRGDAPEAITEAAASQWEIDPDTFERFDAASFEQYSPELLESDYLAPLIDDLLDHGRIDHGVADRYRRQADG